MQLKTKGIVLSETPYSETSKILNILTEDFGLIGVISKGCKGLKSKLRGISNKMNYGEYTINYKENSLSTLIEGNTLNSFKDIYHDMRKAMYSFYIMDLVNQVLKENNTKEIFPLLEQSLIKINEGLSPELISNILEINLLKYLGVSINLDSCIHCGKENDFLTVDASNGGIVCKDCYEEGYLFNPKALRLLCLLNKINLAKLEKLEITDYAIFKEIDDFIHEYYAHYTGIYLKDKNNLLNFDIV